MEFSEVLKNVMKAQGEKMPNQDEKTGIHYGVIPLHAIDYACDSLERKYYCDECDLTEEEREDSFSCGECESFDEYKAEENFYASLDSYGDFFVEKSLYFTLCAFCSPCAPNAGYLTQSGNVKAFCFGADFFDRENIPYDIYSVETGEKVASKTTGNGE